VPESKNCPDLQLRLGAYYGRIDLDDELLAFRLFDDRRGCAYTLLHPLGPGTQLFFGNFEPKKSHY